LCWREVRKACQAKREAREKRPVMRGARKMADVQAGEEEAFWKGKTIRVADAILEGVSRWVVGADRVGWRRGGLQEKGAHEIDVFPGTPFERGEVFLLWPGEEEHQK
jgi:hypothetical protein